MKSYSLKDARKFSIFSAFCVSVVLICNHLYSVHDCDIIKSVFEAPNFNCDFIATPIMQAKCTFRDINTSETQLL